MTWINNSPTEDHNGEELAGWKLDEEICNHGLPHQLRDINDSTKPTVLIANQICVFNQTKDRSVAQGSLVERLQKIYR